MQAWFALPQFARHAAYDRNKSPEAQAVLEIVGTLKATVLQRVVKQVMADTGDKCERCGRRREAYVVEWLYQRRAFIRKPREDPTVITDEGKDEPFPFDGPALDTS
jgi:hypothetical protein